jgi:hypothetical protein
MNSTIGGTGLRMLQAEMLRKFMCLAVLLGALEECLVGRGLPLRIDLLAGVQERTGRDDHHFLPFRPEMIDTPLSSTEPTRTARRSASFLALTTIDVIAIVVGQHRRSAERRGAVVAPAEMRASAKPPGRMAEP